MPSLFAPVSSSFLGFDRLFDELDFLLNRTSLGVSSGNFPPNNIFKEDDGSYTLELALAGYKKSDISIEHDRRRGLLTITGESSRGRKTEDAPTSSSTDLVVADPQVVKQGIATRKFTRQFTLADDLQVASADLEDGMLTIKLQRVVREEDKPLLIPLK